MRKRISYPMGSISSGTMRAEDLIPTFCGELSYHAKHDEHVAFKTRRAHIKLVKEIEARITDEREFEDTDLGIGGCADDDLDSLFDALGEYAAPYFYFGAHPGDGADYGYWLSESWDEDFQTVNPRDAGYDTHGCIIDNGPIQVTDSADIPKGYRGEVAVVSDHGNVALYVKTSRGLREIWSVV